MLEKIIPASPVSPSFHATLATPAVVAPRSWGHKIFTHTVFDDAGVWTDWEMRYKYEEEALQGARNLLKRIVDASPKGMYRAVHFINHCVAFHSNKPVNAGVGLDERYDLLAPVEQ